MQIQHQNLYPQQQGYQNYQQPPPPYYNQFNPYFVPQFPPNYQPPPQQQQKGGIFQNFIMNQLQNNMHGSGKSIGSSTGLGSHKNIW